MNRKHRHIITLLLGAGLLGLSGVASAAIVGSLHDLGSATGANNTTTGTDETCVFCHTPHKAASATVPLWNKSINTTGTGLTPYSSTTIDGTTTFAGSTSMACLSCHDGTQAMDNIVNAPGSGGYDSTGGGAGGLGWAWTGTTVDATTGTLTGTALANLSTNLGDDHPVAIQYGGGGLTTAGGSVTDPDFRVPDTGVIAGENKWWFEVTANGRIDSSEIRLYTRDLGDATGAQPFVECASCHDPHGVGTNPTFLRIANTSSNVCTACHVK